MRTNFEPYQHPAFVSWCKQKIVRDSFTKSTKSYFSPINFSKYPNKRSALDCDAYFTTDIHKSFIKNKTLSFFTYR